VRKLVLVGMGFGWLGMVACGGGVPEASRTPATTAATPPPSAPTLPPLPSPTTTSAPPPRVAALNQGVRGRVLRKVGNFMPGTVGQSHTGGSVSALSVPVHVYRGVIPVATTFDPKHAALVTSTTSSARGDYEVALPPGTYTVVAEIDGKLYLNGFDGSGNWSTVDVAADSWKAFDIHDTSHATF
jgi:hypothetical protein